MLITAITLGELSFGPHATDDPAQRAGRVAVLPHVAATFDPLPYDQGPVRLYGQICAAVRAAGREPRKQASDLMIAATAASVAPSFTRPTQTTSKAPKDWWKWLPATRNQTPSERVTGIEPA